MANFLYISYLKTVLCWRAWFYHSAVINEGHFWAKKTRHTAGSENFFLAEIFWNLWRIDILHLSHQHVKFCPPTLSCCRETLPKSFENSAKGGPQGKFTLSSKFKFFRKSSHLMANFLYISYLKTVLCWRPWFYHSALINEGHFWAKKTCHTAGSENFFLAEIF